MTVAISALAALVLSLDVVAQQPLGAAELQAVVAAASITDMLPDMGEPGR